MVLETGLDSIQNYIMTWDDITPHLARFGRKLAEQATALFLAAVDNNTPAKAKVVIFAALAYLVNPLDAVPDFVPFMGFTDDVTALGVAANVAAAYLTDEIRVRAAQIVKNFFA